MTMMMMMKGVICVVAMIVCVHGTNVFNPAPFPCAYTANFKVETIMNDTTVVGDGFHSMWGNYISMHTSMSEAGISITQMNIMRPDIPEEGKNGSAAVLSLFWTDCDYEYVQSYDDGYYRVSYVYSMIAGPIPYDEKESSEWEGKKCTLYKYKSQSMDSEIYVGDDDHVIGSIVKASTSTVKASFSYDFTAYADDFILPKSEGRCSDLPKAFEDPEPVPGCEIPHTRPTPQGSSDASTLVVLTPLILAVVLAIFI